MHVDMGGDCGGGIDGAIQLEVKWFEVARVASARAREARNARPTGSLMG